MQIYVGHLSAEQVYKLQPSKLAAMESQWNTIAAGQPANWSLLAWPNNKAEKNDWEIVVPNGLGYILELKKNLSEPVQGLKAYAPQDRPQLVGAIYYAFRTMIAIGFFLAGVMLWSTLQWLRGKLAPDTIHQQRWLMRAWIFAAPLGYIAVDSGWLVRCTGRQPWTVYGLVRTANSASDLPPAFILTSLTGFTLAYSLLFVATLYFGSRIIRRGPRFDLPLPGLEAQPALETTPGQFAPDERPAEAQQ